MVLTQTLTVTHQGRHVPIKVPANATISELKGTIRATFNIGKGATMTVTHYGMPLTKESEKLNARSPPILDGDRVGLVYM